MESRHLLGGFATCVKLLREYLREAKKKRLGASLRVEEVLGHSSYFSTLSTLLGLVK
jgi:hypothetical protein